VIGVLLDSAPIFPNGTGIVEGSGDSFAYRDFRIKNLPEIFGK